MIVPDVNLLVALFRSDHEHHRRARAWWDGFDQRDEDFAVPDLVWVGAMRIMTNRAVFARPSSFDEAWGAVAALLADPRSRSVGTSGSIAHSFDVVGSAVSATGNLVTDAYIAAVAVSLGASVVTFDRDFRKFDGVRVIEPA